MRIRWKKIFCYYADGYRLVEPVLPDDDKILKIIENMPDGIPISFQAAYELYRFERQCASLENGEHNRVLDDTVVATASKLGYKIVLNENDYKRVP